MRFLQLNEATASKRRVFFVLVDATTGSLKMTGKAGALAGFLTKKGATPAAIAGSFVEVDAADMAGLYYYEAAVGEVDTEGRLVFEFTCTGCLARTVVTHVGETNEALDTSLSAAISTAEGNIRGGTDTLDTLSDQLDATALEATTQSILADTGALDTRIPADPADQSAVEGAIAASEGNIRGADSDDLKTISDEIDAVPTVGEIDTQLSGTHGAGDWGAKSAGTSPLTITVKDSVTLNIIPGVVVHARNSDGTIVYDWGVTDANGQVAFLLDDATYYVWCAKTGVYAFTNPTVTVVDGVSTKEIQGTAFSPSTPPTPETCVIHGYTHDIGDLPVSVDVQADLVSAKQFTLGGVQVIKSAKTVSSAILDGYWEIVLTRSGEYTAQTVKYSFKINGIVMGEYVIPDQTSVAFADLPENSP